MLQPEIRDPRYVSVKTAAAHFGMSERTVTLWCRRGKLKAIQPAGYGGAWLVDIAHITELAESAKTRDRDGKTPTL
jgi:transposase